MRTLILKNHLCPGDVVALTAAVRDLHRTHPGRYLTDVRTPFQALWEHNPPPRRWTKSAGQGARVTRATTRKRGATSHEKTWKNAVFACFAEIQKAARQKDRKTTVNLSEHFVSQRIGLCAGNSNH